MNTMEYKGFAARVEYSEDDGCFVGHVAGIRDVIGFHGVSVAKLRAAFEEAVDDYLATCKKLGQTPNKPYSGQFRLRACSNGNKPRVGRGDVGCTIASATPPHDGTVCLETQTVILTRSHRYEARIGQGYVGLTVTVVPPCHDGPVALET